MRNKYSSLKPGCANADVLWLVVNVTTLLCSTDAMHEVLCDSQQLTIGEDNGLLGTATFRTAVMNDSPDLSTSTDSNKAVTSCSFMSRVVGLAAIQRLNSARETWN